MAKKIKFRDGYKIFVENHFDKKEGSLSDNQRSQGLALFYLSEVFSKLNPGVISDDPEDILSCIVDGKDDQGVDVVFSHDTQHYLIQFKYRGQKKIESDKDVLEFKEVFRRIHPDIGSEFKKNQNLLDAIAGIDWKQDEFVLLFVSLSRANDDIRNYENQEITSIEHSDLKDIDDRTSFRFLSEEDLNIEYRDSRRPEILTNISLRASKDINENYWYAHQNKDGLRSFITTIDAAQIHKLYQQNRSALFNLNIRNFVGDTSTNKGIIKTARAEPENFFFFNNGISAIASKITEKPDDGMLDCENFSIINGAQTFRSISKAYTKQDGKSEEGVKSLNLMIRLTEAPNLFKETEFIERITQYNNTQNAVKVSDFRSNDGVQTALAKHFSTISYQGKKYYYKNKRGIEKRNNSTIAINLDDFCKTIHSFDKGPVDCFGGIKYLYETKSGGGYFFLFGDEESNSILDSLNDEKLQSFAAKYFICETAKALLKEEKESRIAREVEMRKDDDDSIIISKRALDGRYLIFFALSVILGEIANLQDSNIEAFLSSEKFENPKWRNEEKKMELIRSAVKLSCDVLVSNYRNNSQNDNFVYRNWFRSQKTLTSLRGDITTARLSELENIKQKYLS
jgi:hypothetical protein